MPWQRSLRVKTGLDRDKGPYIEIPIALTTKILGSGAGCLHCTVDESGSARGSCDGRFRRQSRAKRGRWCLTCNPLIDLIFHLSVAAACLINKSCFFNYVLISSSTSSSIDFGPVDEHEAADATMASRYNDDSNNNRSRSASPPFQDTPTTLLSQSQHFWPPTPGRKVTCPHSQLLHRKPRR